MNLVTKKRVALVYECLRVFPPFCRLSLPPAHEVNFRIKAIKKSHYAEWQKIKYQDEHYIIVSTVLNRTFTVLAMSVGHEMIHIHQSRAKTESPKQEHNEEFKKIAKRVCRYFGWELQYFL